MLNNDNALLNPYILDWNLPKPIGDPYVYRIFENMNVSIQLYYKRNQQFYDVVLHTGIESFPLGTYSKIDNDIRIKYKDGKILIYYDKYNHDLKCFEITEVLGVYDVCDDSFYCDTQSNLLSLFDSNISQSELKADGLITTKYRKEEANNQSLSQEKTFTLKSRVTIVK